MMARGNGRQRIVQDDRDRQRLLDNLRRTVLRSEWEMPASVFMAGLMNPPLAPYREAFGG